MLFKPPSSEGSTLHTSGETGHGRPQRDISDESVALLREFARRSGRNKVGAQLLQGFVRREDHADPPPPLTQMLRGGQGGEVRLKLYLSMLLLAFKTPYNIETPIPARVWAAMLGLRNPDHNGARRVNDALDWLAEHRFVVSERRPGTPRSIRLLSQLGDGGPYKQPYGSGRFLTVPLGVWQNGWIVRLSGTALALLIILLDMRGGRTTPPWISPSQARKRYDLSADTWTKGVHELDDHDLVRIIRQPIGDTFDYRRLRNAYQVNEKKLGARAGAHPPGTPQSPPAAVDTTGDATRQATRPK
jgi:hypothetical protein